MSTPIIIGLTGLAGAGKDTVADTLVTHAGFSKLAFADALRLEIAGAYNLGADADLLVDRATKERPHRALAFVNCTDAGFVSRMAAIEEGKDNPDLDYTDWVTAPRSPRAIMQWWGTEYRRAQAVNYWSTRTAMRIYQMLAEGRDRIVVTDCRFENEAKALRTLGGELWRVTRTGQEEVEGNHASRADGSALGSVLGIYNGTTIMGLMHSTLRALQTRFSGLVLPDDIEAAAS